ncbi:MAG: Gfo/Idh/MocA family oxidoreductase [Lentisphaerae bacterium]|nr:Gfo/Idh/MocA family oxidoreductase [Lentisphaerota bacterium]
MLTAGIIGFGGMGHVHARAYLQRPGVQLAAAADIREEQLGGASMELNLGATGACDMRGVRTFLSGEAMLAETELDLVSICLPTDLHADYTIKALEAGCHVLCEKPMARTLAEADAMIAAQQRSGRLLMIGQCLRFWPAYEKLAEACRGGTHGRLLLLSMRRISPCPGGKPGNWFLDGARSGGALLDMHIHDTDFVHDTLGLPRAVATVGYPSVSGAVDTAVTQYRYDAPVVVAAETTWDYGGRFGMSFCAVFEKATLEMPYGEDSLRLLRPGAESVRVDLPAGNGHAREIEYFVNCIANGMEPERCTPFSARETLRIALAEEASALAGGTPIPLEP